MNELGDVLTGLLERTRAARRVPALSAAVGRGGEVVWARVAAAPWTAGTTAGGAPADGSPAGGPTAEHAFRIGSITKPMIAVAVLRLVSEGLVALADPIGRHLPDAPAPDATIRHLLTHTSGLQAEFPGPWWERHGGPTWDELAASGVEQLWDPGEQYHYSNPGFAVLGRLVEVVRGGSWDKVLRAELWEPLGMTATGRAPVGPHVDGYAVHPDDDLVHHEPVPDYRAAGPAGEVWSTPSDLVRFGMWLVGREADRDAGEVVLPLELRRQLAVPRVVVDDAGPAGGPWATAHGLGVRVRQDGAVRTVGHGGSVPGFTADLRADVTTGDVVAVCGSSTAGFGDGTVLLAAFQGHGVPAAGSAPDEPRPTPQPGSDGLAGTWYWGPVPFDVRVDAAGRVDLRSRNSGGRGTLFDVVRGEVDGEHRGELRGVDGGYWLGERLRVVEAGGAPVALDVGTFHLTRAPYDPGTAVPGGVDGAGWHRPGPVG
ncbi:serine hydrolase domain-containing protein [Promicromonospora sp. NPDC057488]|uniref:serine hydrolase domain-containing protein n=1 Tax=Promicromonospora sp. NPDC057488 TaxID=3346147 RepID=UPI003671186A